MVKACKTNKAGRRREQWRRPCGRRQDPFFRPTNPNPTLKVEQNESDGIDGSCRSTPRYASSVKGDFRESTQTALATRRNLGLRVWRMAPKNVSQLLACLAAVTAVLCEDGWSPAEGDSTFEPSATVLEQWSGLYDRNDKVMKKPDRYVVNRPPKEPIQMNYNKEVTETDLFLLGAIEKLAYKLESVEKRLTRAEELLYRLVSGSQFNDKQEPCPEHFQRHGGICYHVSGKQVNWKSASSACRNLNSVLLEFETQEEEKSLLNSLLLDPTHHGKDFWTGGLNPGLLWIWSNSAKPVLANSTQSAEKHIDGNGRCLLLKYQALTKEYIYRGIDCSSRFNYICRFLENSVGRKLERLQRELRFRNASTKV